MTNHLGHKPKTFNGLLTYHGIEINSKEAIEEYLRDIHEEKEHYRLTLLEVDKKLEPHGIGGMSPDDCRRLQRRIRISVKVD